MAAKDVTLHWYPATCARVTLTALEEIGAPFTVEVVNKAKGENDGEAYRRLNPKGKVPTLIVDGRVLTETPAILVYLDRQHPEAGLLPKDEDTWLEALSLMSWFAGGIHPVIARSRFPMNFAEDPRCFTGIRDLAVGQLAELFQILEARLADRSWLLGEWSIADAYMSWLWFRATGSGMDEAPLPRCVAHYAENGTRPSLQRAVDREAEVIPQIEAGIDGPSPFSLPKVP